MKYQGKITDPKDLVTKEYVDTGLSGKQTKITASGVLIGNGSGGVTAKTLDTSSLTNDNNHVPTSGVVKSALNNAKALSFTVTLAASSWSNNAQTVSNAYFIASGYAYTVCPSASNFTDYANAQIYADDVTTNGSMTFHCDSVPSSDLTVNILRTEVSA